jgi:hypothetical protein
MDYDICDPVIRCNADKEGATVFEVFLGHQPLRVLTFDLQRAEEIAQSWHLDRASPEEEGTLSLF